MTAPPRPGRATGGVGLSRRRARLDRHGQRGPGPARAGRARVAPPSPPGGLTGVVAEGRSRGPMTRCRGAQPEPPCLSSGDRCSGSRDGDRRGPWRLHRWRGAPGSRPPPGRSSCAEPVLLPACDDRRRPRGVGRRPGPRGDGGARGPCLRPRPPGRDRLAAALSGPASGRLRTTQAAVFERMGAMGAGDLRLVTVRETTPPVPAPRGTQVEWDVKAKPHLQASRLRHNAAILRPRPHLQG